MFVPKFDPQIFLLLNMSSPPFLHSCYITGFVGEYGKTLNISIEYPTNALFCIHGIGLPRRVTMFAQTCCHCLMHSPARFHSERVTGYIHCLSIFTAPSPKLHKKAHFPLLRPFQFFFLNFSSIVPLQLFGYSPTSILFYHYPTNPSAFLDNPAHHAFYSHAEGAGYLPPKLQY